MEIRKKKPSPNYQIYAHVMKECEGEDAVIINRKYNPEDLRRYNDSENLIINLFEYLVTEYNEVDFTELHLFSELPPCKSCTGIINSFVQFHPEIKVRVYYHSRNHKKASPGKNSFYTEDKKPVLGGGNVFKKGSELCCAKQ